MPYFVLFYETADNYVEKRAPYRGQHLELARAAHARGELLLAGALADPADRAVLVFRTPDKSAVEEFAHQVFALRELVKPFPGATLNIGVVKAGTRSNVVPEYLNAEIDVRVGSTGDGEAIDGRLKALAPRLPGAALRVSGGINRPPLERTESVVRLFGAAAAVAREQGWMLQEGATGGGSDGSFTAALGIPTLDGLGPDGNGAHALDEHVLIEDLPRRLALVAGLLERMSSVE